MRDFISDFDMQNYAHSAVTVAIINRRIRDLAARAGGNNVANSQVNIRRNEESRGWDLRVVFLSSGWTGIEARTCR